jgi:hypothetical protein
MSGDGADAAHKDGGAATDPLTAAYQRFLRLFPPAYRDEREEEMLAVLLECAEPGRTTMSWAERLDLGRLAAVAWTRTALGPSPTARRDGAAVLAILLPLVLLFPAGRIAIGLVEAKRAHFLRYFLQSGAWDAPAWGLWTVAAALVLVGLGRWARWPAVAALAVYIGLLGHQLVERDATTFAHASGWLLAQVVTAALLWSPERAARGTALVRARWRWGIAVGVAVLSLAGFQGVFFGGLGFLGPHGYGDALRIPAGLVLVAGLVLAVAYLRTETGRVVVPTLGACAAFALASRPWSSQVSNTQWHDADFPDLHLATASLMLLAPLVAFVAVRILGELISRDEQLVPAQHPAASQGSGGPGSDS